MALQAIFQPAEKTRVFLQYDPARGYDLAENRPAGAALRDQPISCRRCRWRRRGGRGGAAQAARAPRPPPLKPEDEQKLQALEQQLVQMFRNYKPGPFAPGIHDVGRESPTKSYLPGAQRTPAGGGAARDFSRALGGGSDSRAADRRHLHRPPQGARELDRQQGQSAHRARDGESHLAVSLRHAAWWRRPSDFGHRGGMPSHPELLDWLATEFVDNGWSMKKLHKLIMTSSAYRQSSEVSKDADGSRRRQRLPLALQPAASAAGGDSRHACCKVPASLNLKMAGRPVVPEVAREELYGLSGNGMWMPDRRILEEHTRRSIYMLARRTFRPAMFESFDAPDGILSCSRRVESNTAPQSLTLLNGQWTMQEANRLAEKLASDGRRRRVDPQGLARDLRAAAARGRSHERAGVPRTADRGAGRRRRPRPRNWCASCSTPTNFSTWIELP